MGELEALRNRVLKAALDLARANRMTPGEAAGFVVGDARAKLFQEVREYGNAVDGVPRPPRAGLCGVMRNMRRCSFPLGHPGVHSWDVQVEPIHHATGKPARKAKGARR